MSKALATKNVAAVLLGVGMILSTFAFATPVAAQTMADLQAQINALLAQIAALQGGSSTPAASCTTFTQNLRLGARGGEVMAVQKFLNASADTQVAATGAGSPGNETSYFGPATRAAVIKFQNKYAADILTPVGLSAGNGNWYSSTRAKANALCAGGQTPTTPTTPTTGGNLMVGAGSQPANSLAPEGASRVPFTTFTVTNTSNAAVTINGVTVQRIGLGDNANFSGVVLIDETGMQIGNSKTLNSNNQASVGDTFTINPGQTKTLTVAGNMATDNSTRAGQVVGLQVVGINTSATVSGSLPISGATHTINATLDIGTLPVTLGPSDLNAEQTNQSIGETGKVGASLRLQAGSAEDVWVKSIRWNQSGSAAASDIANVVTVIDGTSYPTTVSSDGKYYTTVFPGNGIQIQKGLTKEVIVRFDIVGGPSRTVNFDVYRATDIYVVGGTFGYGITPTQSQNGSVTAASTFTSSNPFFSGSTFNISAGSFTSLSRANEVPAQNIVEATPNQVLGGFAMDVKGEPISVGQMVFFLTETGSSADGADFTNVTLVDANGAIVAGPVNGVVVGGTNGKVTFSDTVTFPTGRHVYTLKGQLGSDFANGDTVIASTTPSADWSNVTGQTTGNTISLSSLSSAVTGNTMTVRGASVVLSIASSPAAQTIVTGVSGQTVSAINFDATQSGEDVRFNAQKFQLTETALTGGDVTNCFAYDGATRLNSTAVQPTDSGTDYSFTFDTALVVPKGTVKTVTIKCDVPAAISSGSFSFGIDTLTDGTGVVSSQAVTPTSSTGAAQAGNTMTVASGGALTVALDSSSPSASLAAAGSTGVTLGMLRFNGTNEDMRLDRVALEMSNGTASSSPDNLTQVTLWDGGTQVGTAIFAGTRYATSTLSGNVTIPANGFKVLTVKGDLAGIGTGQATTTNGIVIEVDYDNDDSTGTRAIGMSSGTTVNRTSTSDTDVSPVRVYRSYPTLAVLDVPSTVLVSGTNTIYRFSITASNTGFGVGINEITANIATSSISALADAELYAFTDAGFSSPVSGFSNGQLDSNSGTIATGNVSFDLGTSELQIPAGGTRYFEIRITATLSGSGTEQISTKLVGDSAASVGATLTVAASTAKSVANFVWSGNATTTSESTHLDWTNGYSVPGLPSGGTVTKTLQKTN